MKPEQMTYEQISAVLSPLFSGMWVLETAIKTAMDEYEAIIEARDKQWEELLSKQEPIIGLQAVHDAITADPSLAEEPGAAEEEDAYCKHKCMCGEPWRLDTVHRSKSPCFDYIEHKWVGLTPEELEQCYESMGEYMDDWALARAVEAKLKEKNT